MGCACTEEQRGGCVIVDFHLLLPVPEKAVNPVTDAWVNVHAQSFIEKFGRVYCVECRAGMCLQTPGGSECGELLS